MNPSEINNNSINAFSVASMVFGVLSLITFCTGIFSLFTGSMGIIFAILSRREARPMAAMSQWGIILSGVGIFMGGLVLTYAVTLLLTDPSFYQEVNALYQSTYGVSLEEMFHY